MTKFDEIYQNIINDIMENGIEELNQRTGKYTKSLPGVCFSTDIEKEGFPVLTLRKQPLKSPIAEQVWFISGNKNAEFLQKFTRMWDPFLEKDNTLETAYGYRWRHHFKRDQLKEAIETLEADPSSRQAVIVTWDPGDDGLRSKPKKNVPCPYTFTLNIIGGRLHMHNMIRSNDMILGCPFDVFGFALLQCIIAQRLKVKPGVYTHSISNAHIYENHSDAADEICARYSKHGKIELKLPDNCFERAEALDETLVTEIFEDIKIQYNPMDKIEGLDIAI